LILYKQKKGPFIPLSSSQIILSYHQMGKKNKDKNNTVTTVEKKTSFIDKLKFMQKNKKPDDKK